MVADFVHIMMAKMGAAPVEVIVNCAYLAGNNVLPRYPGGGITGQEML